MSSKTGQNDCIGDAVSIAITVCRRQNQRCVGAVVHKRHPRTSMEDNVLYSLELYDFMDNEQLSNLDSFLVQMGSCIIYLSDEFDNIHKGDGKIIHNICEGKSIERVVLKKTSFNKTNEVANIILKLCGKQTHVTNVAETERPLAYGCIECLVKCLRLLDDDENYGRHVLRLGSLSKYMKLDSAAADAVNLLPKSDHPSQFGSIFGVLNRCKSKIGSRLLERWLRQPLLDVDVINCRLDVVEILKSSILHRNRLCDGPLKGIPDLDLVLNK